LNGITKNININNFNKIIRHCKHYSGRGLMKKYNNGAELAADMVNINKYINIC